MSNVIKAYSVRYDEVVKKTIDLQLKVSTQVKPIQLTITQEPEGEFVEGINALFVDQVEQEAVPTAKASEIIENAKQEARFITEQARREAEQIKKDAYTAGNKRGYEEGLQLAKEENDRLQIELRNKESLLESRYEEKFQTMEAEMVNLIIAYVQKITGVIIKEQEDVIIYLLRTAIKDLERSGEYTIRVSTEDYEYVTTQKDVLLEAAERKAAIYINEDVKLQKNQCFIETDRQVINCSLDNQLKNLILDLKLLGGIS